MSNNFLGNDPSRESRHDEKLRARRAALSAIMVLLLVLLILLLLAAATDRTDILRFGDVGWPMTFGTMAAFQPRIAAAAEASPPAAAEKAAQQVGLAPSAEISARLRAYYERCGGERIFGRPISALITEGGRTYQWFERARLEYDPQLAGTPYEVQGGRLGAEYTAGQTFPRPAPFPSQPGARFFPETGYGVSGAFLRFWEQNGGVEVLGYPISGELQETLSDGQVHTVQYFERARLELHPQHAGTPYEIQLGLLGRALYRP
ncbi:MAG: hypothetical protein DIU80_016140 [Chloroflexota bacterium]|nr:MAG: hypothetical protein DIU80_15120 [Chloroflexota bacterium]